MMRASLGIGVDGHRPGPDLLRADAGMIDRGATVHAWGLRRVGVERSRRDHPHPVMFPLFFLIVHGFIRAVAPNWSRFKQLPGEGQGTSSGPWRVTIPAPSGVSDHGTGAVEVPVRSHD